MAINAVLAIIIIADGVLILLKPFDGGLDQPLAKRLPGVRYVRPSKPCRWRGKQLNHGGDVCVIVFSLLKAFRARVFCSRQNGLRC